ncbi:unnamed protein product [marine sediment metagenome]|uniref:Uncharacterized protein n=1 Tax=marine sediment metagenome TaxID=412755 RepID=X1J3Y9_9ZZZZ
MQIKACSICGKPTITGGLCYKHGGAYYDYAEEGKYCEEEKDEKQGRNSRGDSRV